jgi:uncharacterized protein YhaN
MSTETTDTTMEVTNFHLGRAQKNELRKRAIAKGTNVAEEIRSAVDAYLAGVTPEELELLDAATRQAQAAFEEMAQQLEETNCKAARIFAELEQLRGGLPPELAGEISVPVQSKAKRGAH